MGNSLKISISPFEAEKPLTMFWIWAHGGFQTAPKSISRHLLAAGYDKKIAGDYEEKMRVICKTREDKKEPTGRFSEIDVEKFKSSVDELIQQIRSAEDLGELDT